MKKSKPKTRKSRKPAELPPAAYDRTPRLQLTLTDETLWLTRFDQGAAVGTYPVSVADAGAAFRGLGQASSGTLPADTLFWQAGANPRLGLWLPPARRVILWGKGKRDLKLPVPLPGLVFVGLGRKYWVWAAPERPAGDAAPLFRAPLPNVNPDGLICAGSVQFPVCRADTIHTAAALFFESQFNGDLSVGRVSGAGEIDLLKFLRSLARARQFPADRLRPGNLTMGQLLDGKAEPEYGRLEVLAGVVPAPTDFDDEEDEDEDDDDPAVFMGDGEDVRAEMIAQQVELMA